MNRILVFDSRGKLNSYRATKLSEHFTAAGDKQLGLFAVVLTHTNMAIARFKTREAAQYYAHLLEGLEDVDWAHIRRETAFGAARNPDHQYHALAKTCKACAMIARNRFLETEEAEEWQ